MKQAEYKNHPIEIWGGVECSVVRINNTIHDQLKMNGHEERISDFDLFADIGIKKLRYPLLWEKYTEQKESFFKIHDERLERLRKLNIVPIAGLLHHGSGPMHTDMSQDDFPEKLADYAQMIATHYQWIEYYTPVNEPLTTARFSGLYGVWYPHTTDDLYFSKIYLNELKGIILAMQKIREVNPNAKLIQTEDIAKIHSTNKLRYQANLENERSLLTYDILTGRFNESHLFWNYFLQVGIDQKDLEFFTYNICEPHICGFNYYVTSERFLDHRIDEYPNVCIGGNDYDDYADIEAVRVSDSSMYGVKALLRDAYNRYKLPIALTEIHLACTREEQLRWFDEAYNATLDLKSEGIDIRAITAWSLLGSFDWNTLLQYKGEYYESGVYDIRSGSPRATALAELIKSYSKGKAKPYNTLLEIPGWWKRNVRVKYHSPDNLNDLILAEYKNYNDVRPVMIFGNGTMAAAFEMLCQLRGIPVYMATLPYQDMLTEDQINSLLIKYKPWAVVNTVGFLQVDEAELSPLSCYRENTLFPRLLARLSLLHNVQMLTFSTDQVFNGKKKEPYYEFDETDPLNVFGMSKRLAEESIMLLNPEVLIVRSSLLMNPFNKSDFLYEILFNTDRKKENFVFSDIVISPSYLPDIINTSLDLLFDKEKGIWHLSGPDAISYYDFAKMAVDISGLDKKIRSIPSIRLINHARRPAYSVLKSNSGIVLPPVEVSIYNYLNEIDKSLRA